MTPKKEYSIAIDKDGKVWLTPVKEGAAPPVETAMTLDEFKQAYPKR